MNTRNNVQKPSSQLTEALKALPGDFMILGAGGKIGPDLALLLKQGLDAIGSEAEVYAVSIFDRPEIPQKLRQAGIRVLEADVGDPDQLSRLPEAENIIYMIGRKFGTTGSQHQTWYVNTVLPYLCARRFPHSRIVAFSTGNIYGTAPICSGGSLETDPLQPIGEYAVTCLGRERVLTHCSLQNQTPMLLFRLNYAISPHYGVLCDLCKAVLEGRPIDLSQGVFNCIWQGDVCEYAIRSLQYAEVPPRILNVSSPQAISIRWAAREFGKRLGKEPVFRGQEGERALFSNCLAMEQLMGPPSVSILDLIDRTARWILSGGDTLNAPTHFETTDGNY